MAFVHSLVKTEVNGKTGWCAPLEIGEAAPHYISFVIPLDDKGDFFHEYTCETITTEEGAKRIDPHEFVRRGEDSFVLRLGKLDLWFTVRPVPKEDRRLPYVGKLRHADFAFLFTEIEPEEPERLDRLYDEGNTFVIGCEPFAHYSGISRLEKKR
ncbi:MAG TPA: hypothetical protein VG013_25370 [Gemmataceae bacterium]|jgi:hypothetical protein|nr:hypothetical protein [Gemmataceae bacterium]